MHLAMALEAVPNIALTSLLSIICFVQICLLYSIWFLELLKPLTVFIRLSTSRMRQIRSFHETQS
jgi:hypothetical protein